MLKYFCSSIVLLALSLQLDAQDLIVGDSSRHRFLPTGIRIGTDMLAIGKSAFNNPVKNWEVNVDADIYRRYYLTADYGSWNSDYKLNNGTYSSDGRYFRVGVDVNFLLKDPDRNMFFLGLRRGHSSFADRSDFIYTPTGFQSYIPVHAENTDAKGNWNELTAGIRIKIWKFIWMGATGRIKFGYHGNGQENLISYDVPGYGKTIKNNWYGFNYQIFFRIPVREDRKPLILPE